MLASKFNVVCFLLCALSFAAPLQDRHSQTVGSSTASDLTGVYQFISETTKLIEPSVGTTERLSPEWGGIWQFQHGYYNILITKSGREQNVLLGVFSHAGTYQVQGNNVTLFQQYAISPLDVDRSKFMQFTLQGDTLILTERLEPYVEDTRKGVTTITLKKLR
jgi:hypothetical protein